MPASISVSVLAHRGGRLEELRLVEDREVVVLGRRQAVRLAEEGADARLGRLDPLGRSATLTAMVRTASSAREMLLRAS